MSTAPPPPARQSGREWGRRGVRSEGGRIPEGFVRRHLLGLRAAAQINVSSGLEGQIVYEPRKKMHSYKALYSYQRVSLPVPFLDVANLLNEKCSAMTD